MLATYQNVLRLFLVLGIALNLTSCSKDEVGDGKGAVAIGATASFNPVNAGKTASATKMDGLSIDKFLINLIEFELEMDPEEGMDDQGEDEDWDDDGAFDFEDEIELEGPFTLDLLAGSIEFLNVEVPNGRYEEVEFKINKNKDPESPLFEKSVLIEGSINGTPFVFWHDFMDEIEVDFEDPSIDLTVEETETGVVIHFDLNAMFNSGSGIDLSQARDLNEDGIIEISPEDQDGNNELAQQIRNRMRDIIDLLDD